MHTGTDSHGGCHDGHDPGRHADKLLATGASGRSDDDQCAQPQPVPQPPPVRGAGAADGPADAPTEANTDNRRTAPSCPTGQVAGSLAADMERRSSKVASQVLQRNS